MVSLKEEVYIWPRKWQRQLPVTEHSIAYYIPGEIILRCSWSSTPTALMEPRKRAPTEQPKLIIYITEWR